MAITINQFPTSPNMGNNDLLFAVESNQTNQPQFQYVADLYLQGGTSYIQRIKQQPNPSGYAVFDFGQIISSYLSSDYIWKTPIFATSSECNKIFEVRFGEQYGTSVSSSISTYNGINQTPSQAPAKTITDVYNVITDGLAEEEELVNWNFASQSYYDTETASIYNTFTHSNVLSKAPKTQSIQDGEYETISIYNGNMFPESDVVAQDVYFVQVNVYNAAGSQIQNFGYVNEAVNGGAPRTSTLELWSAVAGAQTNGSRLIHIGVGPANFDDAGNTLNTAWAYYDVTLYSQGDDGLENSDGVWDTLRFEKSTGECAYNGVRFAWKNEFGVWDYYTFTLQSDSTTNIQRTSYEQTFVDYSTTSTSVPYSKQRRGTKQLYNALNQVKTANSNWLTQAEADWLTELFYSTEVYVQTGTDFEPVVITSSTVTEKTNPRTQKNFQYNIEFSPANQPRPRI